MNMSTLLNKNINACFYPTFSEDYFVNGNIVIIPNFPSLEKVKEIINFFSEERLLQGPLPGKISLKNQNQKITVDDTSKAHCVNTLCELIAKATFWDSTKYEYPGIQMIDKIITLGGKTINSEEIKKLHTNNEDFAKYMVALKYKINFISVRKLDFKEVEKRITADKNCEIEYNSFLKFAQNENKFDILMSREERGSLHTNGYTTNMGQEVYLSKKSHSNLREAIGTGMHELTHAYLAKKLPFNRNRNLEEGLCEYVEWWSLINVMNMDEKTATNHVSGLKKYKSEFEEIKSKYGHMKNLSDVIDAYIRDGLVHFPR